jgi:hypothetical protein
VNRTSPWTALVTLVGVVLALGCGGYSITIQPPPGPSTEAATEVVAEVAPEAAPVAPAAAAAPAAPATKPRPTPVAPAPAPLPAPAPPPARTGTGQIQVTTGAAVQAIVDGVPMPFTAEQGYVSEVSAGTHQLEIMNLVGALVASQAVDVPAGKRVRFSYKPKTLTQTGIVEASPVPIPEPVYVPAPAPIVPGSVQITGLASYGDAVFVDGYAARFDARQGSYLSSGLTPGDHDLRVEIDGRVAYSGPVHVRSGENHRCLAAWDGWQWTLDCHFTRPAL